MYSDHEYISSVTGDESSMLGTCAQQMNRRDGTTYICGKSWTSVLHPPDQFRHWCSALENGYDCMHFEYEDGPENGPVSYA